MTDTTQPEKDKDSEALVSHIQAVSQNARTTWFAQLAVLAFTVITLMSFRDHDFFVGGASIVLPVVGTEVPPILYLWFGPPLVLATHWSWSWSSPGLMDSHGLEASSPARALLS